MLNNYLSFRSEKLKNTLVICLKMYQSSVWFCHYNTALQPLLALIDEFKNTPAICHAHVQCARRSKRHLFQENHKFLPRDSHICSVERGLIKKMVLFTKNKKWFLRKLCRVRSTCASYALISKSCASACLYSISAEINPEPPYARIVSTKGALAFHVWWQCSKRGAASSGFLSC